MLVLTRKHREQIQIGDDIVITILQVKGQAVRVGIEAPRNVNVVRSELQKPSKPADEDRRDDERSEPAAMVHVNQVERATVSFDTRRAPMPRVATAPLAKHFTRRALAGAF